MFTTTDMSNEEAIITMRRTGIASQDHTEAVSSSFEDPLADVFGSAPASPSAHNSEAEPTETIATSTEPSDIPRLRSIHVTNGYREGIALGKEQAIQAGFDEGYMLGAEFGLAVGYIHGVLEALLNAVDTSHDSGIAHRELLRKTVEEATQMLQTDKLFGSQYFGADGIWLYEVIPAAGKDSAETEILFKDVASQHPVIQDWSRRIDELASELKLELSSRTTEQSR